MKTILVVDDEPKIVDLARDYLEYAGFAVRTAGDGPAALDAVQRHHPDLVVLDLGLPGLDGLDVTRRLRHDSNLPVIMLTARDDELDKLLGLELGADDYLTKPFSPRELVARVRAVLRRADAGSASPAGELVRVLVADRTSVMLFEGAVAAGADPAPAATWITQDVAALRNAAGSDGRRTSMRVTYGCRSCSLTSQGGGGAEAYA